MICIICQKVLVCNAKRTTKLGLAQQAEFSPLTVACRLAAPLTTPVFSTGSSFQFPFVLNFNIGFSNWSLRALQGAMLLCCMFWRPHAVKLFPHLATLSLSLSSLPIARNLYLLILICLLHLVLWGTVACCQCKLISPNDFSHLVAVAYCCCRLLLL